VVSASCLLDTDVLIDWLQGRSWTKEVISSRGVPLYCSAVTRKELLSKPGISSAERERILRLLRVVRVISVDSVIAAAASELLQKYPNAPLHVNDALIGQPPGSRGFPCSRAIANTTSSSLRSPLPTSRGHPADESAWRHSGSYPSPSELCKYDAGGHRLLPADMTAIA